MKAYYVDGTLHLLNIPIIKNWDVDNDYWIYFKRYSVISIYHNCLSFSIKESKVYLV